MRSRLAMMALCLAISAGSAAGTDAASLDERALPFQEIPSVYTASKYEQKVTEAPSAVSVVTAAEIEKYGATTTTSGSAASCARATTTPACW
jgi:iron complex outermembrane receptor protein